VSAGQTPALPPRPSGLARGKDERQPLSPCPGEAGGEVRPLDVLSVGNFCVDVLIRPVRRLPEPGGLEIIDDYSLLTGGCGNNCAIALARLGLSVASVGRIGADRAGEIVLEELRANGVRTEYLLRDQQRRTSLSVVAISEDGQRSFFHLPGASAALSETDVPLDVLATVRALHIGGAFLFPGFDGEPMARVLAQSRLAGALTFVDTAVDGAGNRLEVLRAALPYMDYFLPSEAEATGMTGASQPEAMAEALLHEGVGTVVIKLGERGCLVASRNSVVRVPAFQVQPVDTCGAGDTFTAGFIAGILKGLDAVAAGRLANAVGAMCVTGLGATTAVGTWEETLRFMERTPLRQG